MINAALALVPMFFAALLIGASAYTIWRGGPSEQFGVATIVVGSVLTLLAANTNLYANEETGILIVDVGVLCAFIAIMKASIRFWPIWITAFQIVAVMTHLARLIRPKTVPMAYAVAEQLWAYLMLATILGAIMLRRRHGIK